MLLSPPVYLSSFHESRSQSWELVLRYVAATAATLLAIAGAQLVSSNSFIWALTALTLIGVPVSLWLRLSNLRIGGVYIPRPLLNSLTVLLSFAAGIYFVFLPMSDFFLPLLTGNRPPFFWMRFGGGEPIEALMRLFLLFAAFRSFALISDKDATLTTVPSFSVLLLLIPIHKGVEVVIYFIAWTFVAATLFALDHRSEVREGVLATVPAMVAGQDVRLGARSLATILGISLAAAIAISLFLTSRDPSERSTAETAVTALATRLTNMALAIPETSANSGPERQIDFKSGPSLPSRAQLWQVAAFTTNRRSIFPAYWRMFALSNYDGTSWTQGDLLTNRVPRSLLTQDRWPLGRAGSYTRYGRAFPRDYTFPGYDVQKSNPAATREFGKQQALIRQQIISLVPNLGFLPVQPAVRAVVLADANLKEIRVRSDGAVDIGVVQINQRLLVLSDVPRLTEYGIPSRSLPAKNLGAAQIAASSIQLAPHERASDLRLPATLPKRVRQLSDTMLKRTRSDASNYLKAQRLALSIQEGATYTLRPPAIPAGRDASDFFLFEGNRRGYCTYFAGALAVLCRAQGIPARVVSGFGGIQWMGPDAGALREGNAHAWTEVWVEGFGWAVVDATPPGDRGDNAPTWIESWTLWGMAGLNSATLWFSNHTATLIALPLILLGFGLVRYRNRRWTGWAWKPERDDNYERRVVGQIYRRTSRVMARKFRPKSVWETPDEWLHSCSRELSTSDTEALRRLTALHLMARYGARPLPPGSAQLAQTSAASVGWRRVKTD